MTYYRNVLWMHARPQKLIATTKLETDIITDTFMLLHLSESISNGIANS